MTVTTPPPVSMSTQALLLDASRPEDRGRATQYRIKRGIDLVFAMLAILFIGPLMLLIALLIKLSSPGPILYRQHRLGKNGHAFTMLKFRTMVQGADQMLDEVIHLNHASGPLFKAKADPRVTPVGGWLRRCYLDELPQLFNILRGEMSLVGPRPCLHREAARHANELAFRFAVPQGLTGPWQTHGHHSITFEEQLRLEREYVEGWSLMTDIQILLNTIPLVWKRTGL